MDKQQAITYIHQMLDQETSCEEIVRGLVDQLHAPEAMVTRFVTQVETEYRKNKPQTLPKPVPPQPVKLPPWLEELSTGQPSTGQPSSPPADQPAEPQPDWMQRLAQSTAVSGTAASAAVQEPLPDWALPPSQQPASVPSTINAPPSWENEAQSFVVAQLKLGRLDSDIADELADRVGIPPDQAESFVIGIASQVQSAPLPKISNTNQAADFVNTEYAKGRPKLEIAAELAMRTGETQNLTEKFVALTIAKYEKSMAQEKPQSAAKASIDLDQPALEKYVVSELAKNRKRSDIVMAICERTGAEWSEAQRFVGQVDAEDHTKINARKNRLIIPMCIGAIALGFVFTIGTAYPMIYWITGRKAEFISMAQSIGSMSNYIQAAPYIFVTGIALIAGGAIGLIMALQSQME